MNKSTDYLTTSQAANELGYSSRANILHLIKDNKLPNSFRQKGSNRWLIPIKDIKIYKNAYGPKNCLNLKQATIRLGYKAPFSIITLINKGVFPNAFKPFDRWWIPISDIEYFESSTNGYLNAEETAHRLNYKSPKYIVEQINNKKFPNAIKKLGNWLIPISDIEMYKKSKDTGGCINLIHAREKLGYKTNQVLIKLLKSKHFPGAFKVKGQWWIPEEDVNLFMKSNYKSRRTSKRREIKATDYPNTYDCLNRQDLQTRFDINKGAIEHLQKKGAFPNAFKFKGKWWFPIKDIQAYEETLKVGNHCLNTSQAAKRLGYPNASSINQIITRQNKLPNAFKVNNTWLIPESDILNFEQELRLSNKKVDYTKLLAFKELKSFINGIEQNKLLKNTKKLFIDYSTLQINNVKGSTRYKRDRILLYKRLYKKMMTLINNEIYLLSTNSIECLLGDQSSFKKHEKKLFISFLNYTYNVKGIRPDHNFSINNIFDNNKAKDIYSPEMFYDIYNYVKDTHTHIPPSLKNRYYVNMWAYTILLLTDFIRGQDLIVNTPRIDISALSISSLDWFTKHELSEQQVQQVINQLYTHFRHKRTSKTNELLTFIVAPDLTHPLAISLVISELHRRVENGEQLLETFSEGKFNTIRTEGRPRHKHFFSKLKNIDNFHFSSRKMNRSVATYLFYSVVEEDGNDSDLALHLTQISRSHKQSDSTSVYIQATNRDGTIDRVSYNLFKRGHFGWLYNYLILYASQFQKNRNTLEERTKLIENIRHEISPLGLENISKFVNKNLDLVPTNDHSKNMEGYLKNIYHKRQSIISKLKNYSLEEIQDIITNLSKGNMPSKNENAQCMVHPYCKHPKLTSCFSCEYVIPGDLLLIQLNDEINRIMHNIENTLNEVMIQRESKFLLHALLIWKEARIQFGDEKVNAFIASKTTWERIEKLAHRIVIE